MKDEHVFLLLVTLFFVYVVVTYAAQDIITLTQDGWVLYYKPSCSYSVKQLNSVGWKSSYLNMVNCDEYPYTCQAENIKMYPTWKNGKTGQAHAGSIEAGELVSTLNYSPMP